MHILIFQGPSVQRFAAITHLAPNDPVEDVLEEVQKYAMLVQGLWVVKTRVRYPNTKGSELLARDYALLLFSKSPAFKDSELDFLGSFKSTEKVLVVLREIAVERPYCKDWKFIEPTDVSFIKHYPDVVEQQQKAWQGLEQHLQQIVDERRARARIGANSKTSGRPGLSLLPHEGGVGPSTSMSKETHKVSR
jgi:DNA-directed RNA polymerase III subunit RPC5